VTARGNLLLGESQWTTGGHLDLEAHQIETGHALAHGVLDLEPRLHLEEVEGAGRIEQELHRPCVLVPRGAGGLDSGQAKGRALLRGQGRAWRLLDDLLMAALERALALAEVEGSSRAVGQDLHLDVPRPVDETLEDHDVVPERGLRFAPRCRQGRGELGLGANHPHALAPATPRRLEDDRPTDPSGRGQKRVVLLIVTVVARNHGHPCGHHETPCALLVSHPAVNRACRPDEHKARAKDGIGEVAVLAQEAVPGKDGVGPGLPGRLEERVDAQVRERRHRRSDGNRLRAHPGVQGPFVGFGIHRDGGNSHHAAGARHAHRDLAAVRDEDLAEGGSAHDAKPGLRFSRNAFIPSWPSGETRRSARRSTV
jgi:hypothetical protein